MCSVQAPVPVPSTDAQWKKYWVLDTGVLDGTGTGRKFILLLLLIQ